MYVEETTEMPSSIPSSPRSEGPSPRSRLTARVHSIWREAKTLRRLTVALVLLLSGLTRSGGAYYSTDIGEQLTLKLEGARVVLNTNSRVSVRDSSSCLSVRIFQGEVLFDIAHRAGRCVEVWAGDALVSDIGTKFDVYLTDDRVTVTVIDGGVELARLDARNAAAPDQVAGSIRLRRGERGEVLRHSATRGLTSQKLDMSRILSDISWERGELIFDSNTLQEIVQQFDRYNRRPQIQIQDASLASRKMSGIFGLHDPESFIADLQQVEPGVRVIRPDTPDGDIILGSRR
jgi:transmembrane sensor